MKNKRYTVQELCSNPSFLRFVKGLAEPEEADRWSRWMQEYEENRELAREAISVVTGFSFSDPDLPDLDRTWKQLQARTAHRDDSVSRRRRKARKMTWLFRVAAVLLLGAFVSYGISLYSDQAHETELAEFVPERTEIGTGDQKKTLIFSNGSRIVLNRHSTLTYQVGPTYGQTIEIELEGEAYFHAEEKIADEQPAFEITTPDGLIRDIGTEFMVTVNETGSRVVLQSGRVEIERGDTNGGNHISMAAGEKLEFTSKEIVTHERVNPTFYTSWATEYMELERTNLTTFASYLESEFGVTVQLKQTTLQDITLTGAVYFRSLEELVRSVSEVTGVPVYQSANRDTVYIGDPYQYEP
ncbi:MAG: FecR family protein [Balneolaceae bacterium]